MQTKTDTDTKTATDTQTQTHIHRHTDTDRHTNRDRDKDTHELYHQSGTQIKKSDPLRKEVSNMGSAMRRVQGLVNEKLFKVRDRPQLSQ